MIYYLTHIKDVIGNNYLGLNIPIGIVEPFLNELREIIEDDYDKYVKLQKDRDHGSYHITVINVMDYNRLSKEMGMDKFTNSLDPIFKYPVDDLKMMGVGTAEKNGNRAYFIVCQSEKLDAIRNKYELPKQDFHITLGFWSRDVFGVKKNETIKKEGKFLKLLRQEYYKNDNFNFIKKIGNFNLDAQSEIIPISINKDSIKVKCEKYFMDVGLIDNNFWILTKYISDKDYPKLPETEIAKILNKK